LTARRDGPEGGVSDHGRDAGADDAAPAEDDAWEDELEWRGRGFGRLWWGWVAFVLSLVGFGVSLYLTVDHFTGSLPICAANGVIDCAKVTTSAESEVFGVLPVALLGLVYFTVLVAVNVPPLWRRWGQWGRSLAWTRLALVVGGIGMVFYLLYAELFSIKAICLWCTAVHVITLLLFVLVVATFPAMVSALGEERR
jgi:uncharacterized membrane protein